MPGSRWREDHESLGVSPLIQPEAATVEQGRAGHRAGAGAAQWLAVWTHPQQPSVGLTTAVILICIVEISDLNISKISLETSPVGSDFHFNL